MLKIGIYDRYLSTAGGGERYSCKMAEILSKQDNCSVDLITDIYSDLKLVSKRLNLDLEKVNLKIFPFLSEEYARKVTEGYDIFINSTYLSSLSAFGKKNFYLCYFPTPFDADFKFVHRFLMIFFRRPAIWFYSIANKLNREDFNNVEVSEGLYDIKRFYLRRGSWSSGRVLIIFRNVRKKITVGIKNRRTSGIDKMRCSVRLYISGSSDLVYDVSSNLGRGDKRYVEIDIPGREDEVLEKEYILDIESDTFFPSQSAHFQERDTRKLGCVVYNEQKIGLIKKIILKLLGFIPLFLISFPKDLKFIESYDKIIAISEYSAKWIKKLWKKESAILYPPVDVQNFKPGKKQKIILSVGRFFPQHHNKKQLELVKCFIELHRDNKSIMSGYKLYLAGGVEDKKEHLEYVRRIEEASRGFPIKIFKNLDWDKLLELFSNAFIFWHASGLGEDEKRNPEKFEHFGITTVEAMAAGCIPVVIDNGGQSEIIEDGFNGFLFNTLEELKAKTMMICMEEIDKDIISKNAVRSSRKFSSNNFKKALLEMIGEEAGGL